MRASLAAAVLTVGAMMATATAQSVPVPTPAPKRDSAQTAPRPPTGLLQQLAPPFTGATSAASSATAFDGNQRALVERVSAYLSNIHTLVGDFVQIGPDGARSEGQFYIQKPGKVRFEYNPPSRIDVVADGRSLVVRDRKLATQDLYPLSQTPLRFLLLSQIDLMRDSNLVSVSADDVFATLVIEDKHQLVGTNRLMLMFGAKDFQLRQWTVTDPQGYDTTVAVYNLDATRRPDPGLFMIDYSNPNIHRAQ
ncbi:MAG TPA: outer membrane lipoprotein carrier protein LolA [Xanthobacteraceae bacterium]